MTPKRKIDDTVDWETQPCPLCTVDTLPKEEKIQWLACEACRQWFHTSCLGLSLSNVATFFCESCTLRGSGTTQLREERPKRAKLGVDYTALDAGQHVNSLRHAYTNLIETRQYAPSEVEEMDGSALTKAYLNDNGFMEPIIVHDVDGLDMSLPYDLTVDDVAALVGSETPIEVMDVPTQGEDKGWTLGRWAAYYKEPSPVRVRNVISLEVSDSKLGELIKRPRIVRELDLVTQYWPENLRLSGKTPKVQAYCLMSLQNSYTDFHVDFAGTSVYYHIIRGSKTFLFIPPTSTNLNKYSDWCKSPDQATRFLADECKDTFKVELHKGDTMFIPSGWIHAVHTPEKSLVIGGNFLHLFGLATHLDIARIEELTKVPGKFRFPYFNKTLWFTAIGVLVQREVPSRFHILALLRLVLYLGEKASSIPVNPGRKILEEVPLDYMQSSPMMVVRVLRRYVQHYFSEFQMGEGSILPEFSLSPTEVAACPIVVKSDISRLPSALVAQLNQPSRKDDSSMDVWVAIPKDAELPVELVPDLGSDREKAEQVSTSVAAETISAVPMPTSPNIYAEQNSYLPPLKAFGPPPIVAPRLQSYPSAVSTEHSKGATTCFRCKTRKRKCDKERPCDSCTEAGLASTCSDSGSSSARAFSNPSAVLDQPVAAMNTNGASSSSSPPLPLATERAQGDETNVVGQDVKSEPQPRVNRRMGSKSGLRCGRCAKDKRPCGRERPVCDRCQKKGLSESDCIYQPNPKKRKSDNEVEKTLNGKHNVSPINDLSSAKSSPEEPSHTMNGLPQVPLDIAHQGMEAAQ